MQDFVLTKSGKEELEKELDYLITVKRPEISDQIKEARAFGDLSENAEYSEARNEQSRNEGRIQELENILKNAVVAAEDDVDPGKIGVGCEVRLLDLEYDEEVTYRIVGSTEANSLKGKISNESPVGAALIGRGAGDVVSIELPAGGTAQYKIISVNR